MDSLSTTLSAYSTVAVAIFAVAHFMMMHADRRQRLRAAHQILWTEWNRLFTIVDRLKAEDLVKMADYKMLDPQELTPPDWGHLGSGLSLIGHGAAKLAGSAFSVLAGARRNCTLLITMTTEAPLDERSNEQSSLLEDLERRTKDALTEVVLLLEDAMALAPRWHRRERFSLGDPKSELGRRLIAELRKRPLSRWQRIRQRSADLMRLFAEKVDPPRTVD